MNRVYTSARVFAAAKLCDMLDQRAMVLHEQLELTQAAQQAADDEHWDAMQAEVELERLERRRATNRRADKRYRARGRVSKAVASARNT